MIKWVVGIYDFYYVNRDIKPKKKKLAEAEAEVAKLTSALEIKQKELKVIDDKVDALT